MNRFDRRAQRGAAWLDYTVGPSWPDRINVDKLNLRSTRDCVLGQVFAGYTFKMTGFQYGLDLLIAQYPGLGNLEKSWTFGFMTFSPWHSCRKQERAWRKLLTWEDGKHEMAQKAVEEMDLARQA